MAKKPSKLVVDRESLKGFRVRAKRAYPKEYVECLWGLIEGDSIYVTHFIPIPHTATTSSIRYDVDPADLRDEAKPHGLKWLGTIHTHCGPNTCPHPSPRDHQSAASDGERVVGILYVYKTGSTLRSMVHFELPSTLSITYK